MKKLITVIFLGIIILVGSKFYNSKTEVVKFEEYYGRALNIGMVGVKPDILEEQVSFKAIELSDLRENGIARGFDGIFIDAENFSEAAEEEYVKIYRELEIPFFFIDSKKGYVPFTEEHLSYEDTEDSDDQMYVTGIAYDNNSLKFWGYGLYNDTQSELNIKNVYSRVFKTISENIQ